MCIQVSKKGRTSLLSDSVVKIMLGSTFILECHFSLLVALDAVETKTKFSKFPHGDYLVWCVRVNFGVRVTVRVDVRVMVRARKLLGSG